MAGEAFRPGEEKQTLMAVSRRGWENLRGLLGVKTIPGWCSPISERGRGSREQACRSVSGSVYL